MNACTSGVGPGRTRPASSRRSLPVRSPFCSDPDRANSLARVSASSTNQEYAYPLAVTWRSAPSASKPGNSGAGKRLPRASSHSDDGPGRIRMPWWLQIGEWFMIPSG